MYSNFPIQLRPASQMQFNSTCRWSARLTLTPGHSARDSCPQCPPHLCALPQAPKPGSALESWAQHKAKSQQDVFAKFTIAQTFHHTCYLSFPLRLETNPKKFQDYKQGLTGMPQPTHLSTQLELPSSQIPNTIINKKTLDTSYL